VSFSTGISSSLATGSLPPLDAASEPAAIRNGDNAAKKAYEVGRSFEQLLVSQLTQELSSTATDSGSGDGSSSDSSGDSSSSASGLMGADSATSAYANMLPEALTSSIMSGGGTGIAMQIAKSIDPALAHPAAGNSQGAKS
jgi:Rod binding domain-containing protein